MLRCAYKSTYSFWIQNALLIVGSRLNSAVNGPQRGVLQIEFVVFKIVHVRMLFYGLKKTSTIPLQYQNRWSSVITLLVSSASHSRIACTAWLESSSFYAPVDSFPLLSRLTHFSFSGKSDAQASFSGGDQYIRLLCVY